MRLNILDHRPCPGCKFKMYTCQINLEGRGGTIEDVGVIINMQEWGLVPANVEDGIAFAKMIEQECVVVISAGKAFTINKNGDAEIATWPRNWTEDTIFLAHGRH